MFLHNRELSYSNLRWRRKRLDQQGLGWILRRRVHHPAVREDNNAVVKIAIYITFLLLYPSSWSYIYTIKMVSIYRITDEWWVETTIYYKSIYNPLCSFCMSSRPLYVITCLFGQEVTVLWHKVFHVGLTEGLLQLGIRALWAFVH